MIFILQFMSIKPLEKLSFTFFRRLGLIILAIFNSYHLIYYADILYRLDLLHTLKLDIYHVFFIVMPIFP